MRFCLNYFNYCFISTHNFEFFCFFICDLDDYSPHKLNLYFQLQYFLYIDTNSKGLNSLQMDLYQSWIYFGHSKDIMNFNLNSNL